jgi:predicted RNase H-like HicB family nuclease
VATPRSYRHCRGALLTYGRTVDEAREMAKDAISGYIASLRKHKDPIPTDDNTLVASLALEYAEVTRR